MTQSTSPQPVPPPLLKDLSRQVQEWRCQLLDTSKRNRLISCKLDARAGLLSVIHPAFPDLWEHTAIKEKSLTFPWFPPAPDAKPGSNAGTPLVDTALGNKLKRLDLAARTSLSEQGVNTLFLAFGMLRWYESPQSDLPIFAPLVLLPVSLDKPAVDSPWDLHPADEDLAPNHPLTELLRSEFALELPLFDEDALRDAPENLETYLNAVQAAIAAHPRWAVDRVAALGTFAFQKVSMWQDLRNNEARVTAHAVCRGLAGDPASMHNLPPSSPAPLSPDAAHIILDCDSSQHQAIDLVQQGKNLVLDGPPGTGKSQTIANIIAQCLADGKTVLFVSEKAAALEVVKRRLDARQLGAFCLECHSHKANKRSVVQELERALAARPETYPSMHDQFAGLTAASDRLTAYVHALHAPRSALAITAFDAHAVYTSVRHAPATRQVIADPHTYDHTRLQKTRAAVEALTACRDVIESQASHPWRNARVMAPPLSLPDDIRHHFTTALKALQECQEPIELFTAEGFLPDSATLPQLTQTAAEISQIAAYPHIPESWLRLGLLPTGQRYARLHAFSETYARACITLNCFKPQTIHAADTQVFFDAAHAHKEIRAVIPALLNDLHSRTTGLSPAISTLTALLIELESTATAATENLHKPLGLTPRSPITLKSTLALVDSLQAILPLRPANPSWFTTEGIQCLANALHQATEIATLADALRTRLTSEAGLLPIAFSRAAIPQIKDVLRHDSFFSRFSGSWSRAKRAVASFYKTAVPFWSGAIVDHMFQVDQWHTYQAQIETLLSFGPAFFPPQPGQIPDLAQAAHHLKALQSLAADFAPLDGLAAALTNLSFNLSLFTQPLSETQRHAQQALSRAQDASTHINLAQLLEADPPHAPLPAAIRKLQDFTASLNAQAVRLTAVSAHLARENQPLDITTLTAHADAIRQLRDLRAQAQPVAAELQCALPAEDVPHLGDWHKEAELAKWLAAFAASHNGVIPDRFTRPLTNPAARETLLAAARAFAAIHASRLGPAMAFVANLFALDKPISTGITLHAATLSQLNTWLQARTADAHRVLEWSRFLTACDLAEKQNLATLRDELLSEAIPVPDALAAFDRAFYLAWLQETYTQDPTLGTFDLTHHNTQLATFKRLDRFWVHNTFTRVRSKVLARTNLTADPGTPAPASSEVGILLREANKKRAHLPLRRLFAAIPGLLLRIKPCIMMSPLSVSTYLNSEDLTFDVVIFDEASQVRPHDAVCSVYRGKQLIVAGDQKQLPPTDFFEKISDEPEQDDADEPLATRDFESILDVCATLPMHRQRLKWHYRSKRESLIAFSNRFFYDNQLVTFPSCLDVHGSSGVTLHHTPGGRWSGQSAGGGINTLEAQAIAQAVLHHAQHHPDKSLGVITMNQAQQLHVLDEIDTLRKNASTSSPDSGPGTLDPGLSSFFDPDKPEPFFVKNLENVQGDERDIIFFGVGYAKNDTGTLSHNFGPLNRQGGERRLNVAVTRARLGLTLFSSILADDIDLSRTQSHGARLLKAYLDFAQHPPTSAQNTPSSSSIQNAGPRTQDISSSLFEDQVAAALQSHNLHIQRSIGCSAFKVDLALTDPADPARFVLGIECDGSAYRDAANTRDRDRLREQVLQSLGWRIFRLWSTDWARDPNRQIALILEAYNAALAQPEPPKLENIPTLAPLPAKPIASATAPKPDDFDNIDQVPPAVLTQTLLDTLHQFGAMPQDDLFLATAKKLGFARTGPRIKEALTLALQNLLQQQKLTLTPDNKIKPNHPI